MSRAKPSDSPFASLKGLRDELALAESQKPKRSSAPPPVTLNKARDTPVDFGKLMSDVKPLSGVRRVSVVPDSESIPQGHGLRLGPDTREALAALDALIGGGARFELQDDGTCLEGRRVEVPMPTLRKLRRGIFPVDARLDMHGMSMVEARDALAMFLRVQRQKGERCVLVIHGKGAHSAGGVGVLRGEIGAWLSQGGSSAHVLAFASAHAEDGGTGAMYVLLRQQ